MAVSSISVRQRFGGWVSMPTNGKLSFYFNSEYNFKLHSYSSVLEIRSLPASSFEFKLYKRVISKDTFHVGTISAKEKMYSKNLK